MARIRSIKPEIRTSEKVTDWPFEVRYFWVLLWGYVNDQGKGIDNPKLIKADAYPLDDEVTADVVEGWLEILAESSVILRYSSGGKRYLIVQNWSEHQKISHPSKDVYPDPPVVLPKSSGEAPYTLAHEQGAGSREKEQGAGSGKPSPHTFPAEFSVTAELREWATTVTPAVDIDRQTFDFIHYWSKGDGAGKKKSDWKRTWQNDMKRRQQWAERDGWKPKDPDAKNPLWDA